MNISCCANQQGRNRGNHTCEGGTAPGIDQGEADGEGEGAGEGTQYGAAGAAAASGARVELYVDKVFVVKSHISNLQGTHARIHKHTHTQSHTPNCDICVLG